MTFPFTPGLIHKPVPRLINLAVAANAAADASLTLAAPAHIPGDYLIAVTGNRTATPPATVAGFTSLATLAGVIAGGSRSLRVQYLVATSTALTLSYVGSYAHVWVIRGVTKLGAFNTYRVDTSSGVIPIPNLSGLAQSESVIISSTYPAGLTVGATSPFTVVGATGVIIQNTRGLNSSLNNATMTFTIPGGTTGTVHLSYALELI